MADVLGRSKLFSQCGHGAVSLPSNRKGPSLAGMPRSSFVTFTSVNSSLNCGFHGRRFTAGERRGEPIKENAHAVPVKMSLCIGKALKWWEKGLLPNMKEVQSAQDLINSLLNAGNQLVIVDFFSPGCGGCKALHPKICQFAEMSPNVLFLQVNYEEHKSMCYSLNVHVLPFFRFYRGAHGRLCSFSCTNATIKKFKDALAKHTTDCCSLGPAKGLEESEFLALAANKDLNFSYTKGPEPVPTPETPQPALPGAELRVPTPMLTQGSKNKSPVAAWR